MAVVGATPLQIPLETSSLPSTGGAGVDANVREVPQTHPREGGVERQVSTETGTAQPTPPRRDFDKATELLDRATQAFEVLIHRCQILEHELDDANERADARAAEQDEAIEQWKRLASGLKDQVTSADSAVATLEARCEAAEARAASAEQKAAALERASIQAAEHAVRAEQLSTKLHDKVVSAFGIGSRAHPVLEAVATRAAAE